MGESPWAKLSRPRARATTLFARILTSRLPLSNAHLSRQIGAFMLGALLCAAPISAIADAQTDFNGDDVSDILAVSTSSGLQWASTPSGGSGTTVSESFGQASDNACPAHWLSTSETALGFVRSETSGKLSWKVSLGNSLQSSVNFGQQGDTAIAGGDFDGNGISDAAIVRLKNKKLRWTIKLNLFAGGSSVKRLNCGVSGDRVLFVNPDATRDWAAAFGKDSRGRSRLLLCDTQSRSRVTKRGFPKSLTKGSRPRPFPLMQEDGSDALGFVTDDGIDTTRVRVYDLTGSSLYRQDLTGLGTAFVGDFLSDAAGEEVALQTSSRISILNPFTSESDSATVVSGTPVDEVNIINTSAPTPTPSPTATATAVPTATP